MCSFYVQKIELLKKLKIEKLKEKCFIKYRDFYIATYGDRCRCGQWHTFSLFVWFFNSFSCLHPRKHSREILRLCWSVFMCQSSELPHSLLKLYLKFNQCLHLKIFITELDIYQEISSYGHEKNNSACFLIHPCQAVRSDFSVKFEFKSFAGVIQETRNKIYCIV